MHKFGRYGRLGGLFVLAWVGLVACRVETPAPAVIVTEIVMVAGEEVEVTRLVRQTVAVTTTPLPEGDRLGPVTLDVGYVGGFPDIDPQTTDEEGGIDMVENLFVRLTRFNHETNQVEPALATNWQVENGRIWTFDLRADVYWVRAGSLDANGRQNVASVRPVTAQDVVYVVHRACTRSTQTPQAFLLFIVEGCERVYGLAEPTPTDLARIGVTAVNDHTLQVTLTQPASYFLTLTSMTFFTPLPAAEIIQWQTDEEDWRDPARLITSGPFLPMPETWQTERVVLGLNPFWPLPRRGNAEMVNMNFLDEMDNAYKLWDANSLDVSPLPPEQREAMLEDKPLNVVLVTDQTVFYLAFNFDSSVFQDPEVRRAFSAAINRQQLVDTIYEGRAIPMRHLIPPGVLGASLVEEVGVGYSPDYARLQMDTSDFRTCRLIPPIRFMITSSDLSLLQAEMLRDMWVEELGCTDDQIVLEQVRFGTLLANTRPDAGAARPDIWELGWASYYPDAHNWVSDLLHCTDSENRSRRPCSAVDDLIRQAAVAVDVTERTAVYRQIENLLFGAEGVMPIVPLYVRGEYVLVHTNWLAYTPARFGGEQFDTYKIDPLLKDLERSR